MKNGEGWSFYENTIQLEYCSEANGKITPYMAGLDNNNNYI